MKDDKKASDKYFPRIKGLVHLGNSGKWNPLASLKFYQTQSYPQLKGVTIVLPFLPDAKNIINPKLAKGTTKWAYFRIPRK